MITKLLNYFSIDNKLPQNKETLRDRTALLKK